MDLQDDFNYWYMGTDYQSMDIKDYLRENDFKDAPYWHNEMATNSCLVGAIWKIGGVAVAEYTINKNSGTDNNGRADIYFSKDKTKYIIEAKFLRDGQITSNNIATAMDYAREDCMSSNEGGHKMAIVFVSPCDNSNNDLSDLQLDYDIQAMLKINGNKKPEYKGKIYSRVYLFAKKLEND